MAIRVTVVYSPGPREVREWSVTLPEGATVRHAIAASGLEEAFPSLDLAQAEVGVWNRRGSWDLPLREQDRIELYRPLKVDPKVARRERFRKQGARAAGLFSKSRPGGKPGY